MGLSYQEGLRMARWMKDKEGQIKEAIEKVQSDNHGVVALRFSDHARQMRIEILDEPYEPDVRIYQE